MTTRYHVLALVLFVLSPLLLSAAEPDISYDNIIYKKKPGVSEAAIAKVLRKEQVRDARNLSKRERVGVARLREMSDEEASLRGKKAQTNSLNAQKSFDASADKSAGSEEKLDPAVVDCGKRQRIEDGIKLLEASGLVEYAEPDYVVELNAVPNDSRYSELWGMPSINAPAAWDVRTDSSPILVGIVDSGINYRHNDLKNNVYANPGEIAGNGIDDDGNGYIDDIYGIDLVNNDSDPNDDNSHGSHVAGTIGAQGNNNLGVVGVHGGRG